MTESPSSHEKLYRLRVTVLALVFALLGILAAVLSDWLESSTEADGLIVALASGLADLLLVAGALGVAVDLLTGRSKSQADAARTRAAVRELAPDFTDAVVRGFAAAPDDLERVATPELLDDLATNALGLRLGDAAFAREIYTELRDNAIHAPERWHDVDVRVRLSSIDEKNTGVPRVGLPAFAVTVTWEYTVVPSHSLKKFACTSDREEFHDLVSDVPSTSTWFMTPRPGFVASDQSSFELLEFSVDGEPRRIRRSAKKSSQVYSVNIGDDVVRDGKPVRIRHVYRTLTAKSGHMLAVAIVQPTRGLTLSLDYTDTDVASMRVSDLVSSARRPRVSRLPEVTPGKLVTIDVDGWLLPQAEVSFVWSLASESQTPVEAQPMLSAGSDRAA